jgi:hypothetical protein
MKYPYTSFSSYNQPRENGGAVYAIWRYLGPGTGEMRGVISKTRYGQWRVSLGSRARVQHELDVPTFAAAKQLARELLA